MRFFCIVASFVMNSRRIARLDKLSLSSGIAADLVGIDEGSLLIFLPEVHLPFGTTRAGL